MPLILVVDDEMNILSVVGRILSSSGYKVLTASNGDEALKLMEDNKPDVIILDLIMPGIDGREVFRRLRRSSIQTKIVYFTAQLELDSAKSKDLRAEADAYIAKPASGQQLLSTVGKMLEDIYH